LDFVKDLFEIALQVALSFARAQVEAGADLIGVGDAAASLIGPRLYFDYVLPFERRLIEELHAMGTRVRLHICGNTRKLFRGIAAVAADQVDLDWMAPLSEARSVMGTSQTLAGNVDPVRILRDGTPGTILPALEECFRQASSRYVVSAGCEVPRDTPEPNLRAMTLFAETHAPACI